MVDQKLKNRVNNKAQTEELLKEKEKELNKKLQNHDDLNNKCQIVSRHMADKWFTNLQNRYLQHGFRKNYNSVGRCLKSLFHIHNETVNIWTHIVGMIMTIFLIFYIYFYISDITGIESKIQSDFQAYFNQTQIYINDEMHCYNEYKFVKYEENQEYLGDFQQKIDKLEEIKQTFESKTTYSFDSNKNNNDLLMKQIDFHKYQCNQNNNSNIQELSQMYQQIQNVITEKILKNVFHYIPFYQETQSIQNPLHKNSKNKRVEYHEVHTWPLTIYQISAFLTFLGSTLFHLFNSISAKVYFKLIRLDYAGIALVLSTGCMAIYYYAYFCDPFYFYTYLIGASIVGSVVFILSFFDFIHSYKHHKLRSCIYGSYGLMLTGPTFQAVIRSILISDPEMTDHLEFGISAYCFLGVFVFGFGGLGLYIMRIPERFKLGFFDIVGQSHNIWHVCCIIVIYLGYLGVYNNYIERKTNFCLVD